MSMSLGLIGRILGLLPFSGVMLIVLLCVSMSVHLTRSISPILAPVSLSDCRRHAVFGLPALIRVSSSSSVGINGGGACCFQCGRFHVLPL